MALIRYAYQNIFQNEVLEKLPFLEPSLDPRVNPGSEVRLRLEGAGRFRLQKMTSELANGPERAQKRLAEKAQSVLVYTQRLVQRTLVQRTLVQRIRLE